MRQMGLKLALVLVVATAGLFGAPFSGVAYAESVARYVRVKNLSPGRILLIRSGPGRSFEPIGFLPHTARHIRNYGCKNLATGRWCELRYRGTRGWANERYLMADKARRT